MIGEVARGAYFLMTLFAGGCDKALAMRRIWQRADERSFVVVPGLGTLTEQRGHVIGERLVRRAQLVLEREPLERVAQILGGLVARLPARARAPS